MTGDYVTVDSTMSAGSTLEKVRVLAHVVLRIYTIYVTGPDNRLDGVLTLRDLLISDPTAPLSQIMAHPRVCITTDTAQERAAKIMATQDIDEIPVIDQAASLVGVVTAKAVATAQ